MNGEKNAKQKKTAWIIAGIVAAVVAVSLVAFLIFAIVIGYNSGYKGALRRYMNAAEKENLEKMKDARFPIEIEYPSNIMINIKDFDWEIEAAERVGQYRVLESDAAGKLAGSLEEFGEYMESVYGDKGFEADKVRDLYVVKIDLEGEVEQKDKEIIWVYVVYKYGMKWYVWDAGMLPGTLLQIFGD